MSPYLLLDLGADCASLDSLHGPVLSLSWMGWTVMGNVLDVGLALCMEPVLLLELGLVLHVLSLGLSAYTASCASYSRHCDA